MIRPKFLQLHVSFWYIISISDVILAEQALLYSLKQIIRTLDVNDSPFLTACPVSTPLEKKFNEEISIGGDCLFSRELSEESGSSQNDIRLDICDQPIKPVILYQSKYKSLTIGYELYYDEKLDDQVTIKSAYANYYYDAYRSVDIDGRGNITFSTKPPNLFFVKYVEGRSTKFKLANESTTYVFFWIPVFFVDYSTTKRRIKPTYSAHVNDEDFQQDVRNITCDQYVQQDINMERIFSEKNQENCFEDLNTIFYMPEEPPPLNKSSCESGNRSCGQPSNQSFDQPDSQSGGQPGNQSYDEPSTQPPDPPRPRVPTQGYLKPTQIIPIWYFRSRSTRLAACTRMNTIPVWRHIADGQLRKVDQYILLRLNQWRKHLKIDPKRKFGDIVYGTNGVLRLPTVQTRGARFGDVKLREVYLWNTLHNGTTSTPVRRRIPVPKIIYRIVSVLLRSVAIIIHNTMGSVLDSDLVCPKESHVPGWGSITNNDSSIGLTYTCSLTSELDDKLGGGVFEPGRDLMLKGTEDMDRILTSDHNKILGPETTKNVRAREKDDDDDRRPLGNAPRYGGGGFTSRYGGNFATRYGGSFAPRYGNSFAPRYGGNFTPRYGGGFAPRYGGSFAPRYGGSFAPRYGGSFAPRYGGSFAPRYGGSFSPRYGGGFTTRYGGNFATRYSGSFTPRFAGNFPPRYGRDLVARRTVQAPFSPS